MRSPLTANEDHPGPIGARHISTGGFCAQSVPMRVPPIAPSRWGPRKPGHSAGLCSIGSGGAARGASAKVRGGAAAGFGSGVATFVSSTRGAGLGAGGDSSRTCASRRSSAVGPSYGAHSPGGLHEAHAVSRRPLRPGSAATVSERQGAGDLTPTRMSRTTRPRCAGVLGPRAGHRRSMRGSRRPRAECRRPAA